MKKQTKPNNANRPEKLTSEQLEFLNKERQKHLNGEGASYTWEEVMDRIRNKKRLSKP